MAPGGTTSEPLAVEIRVLSRRCACPVRAWLFGSSSWCGFRVRLRVLIARSTWVCRWARSRLAAAQALHCAAARVEALRLVGVDGRVERGACGWEIHRRDREAAGSTQERVQA